MIFQKRCGYSFYFKNLKLLKSPKTLIMIIDRSKGKHIITLHSDRGGEFLSTTFNKFLEAKGIKR
jgi:transposase InsO family protein